MQNHLGVFITNQFTLVCSILGITNVNEICKTLQALSSQSDQPLRHQLQWQQMTVLNFFFSWFFRENKDLIFQANPQQMTIYFFLLLSFEENKA